ncbi:ribosome recycling factor [Candidatus Saccharibacteria bacterium]|nr:ribosome recycling factor [Candidatus Saccharibacteria bacterium]MCL1962781.1 ribosome recycling factor [Candidatus Saccharibacteria bacterium]
MDTAVYEQKFAAAIAHFEQEVKKIRTGRAHPDMLDGVMVEVYGTKMPLNQVASVSAPEPQQILVTPFDVHNVAAIAAAIRNDITLGFNPSDDGRNVRVPIPALTEERRRDIVRNLSAKVEDAKVALRNIREDARKVAKVAKEAKTISEDDQKRIEKGIDDDVAKNNAKIDDLAKAKEAEIMKV